MMMSQISNQRVEFTFPTNLLELELIANPQEAKESILAQAYVAEIDRSSVRYRTRLQRGTYCYLSCSWKGCRAGLHYRSEAGRGWRLMKANCQHVHLIPRCKKLQFEAVFNYLDSVPFGTPHCALKKVVCADFGVTEKQFYYLLSKCKEKPINIAQLSANL